ncbi:putative DNA helicase, partial [Tanacetum coccineum]
AISFSSSTTLDRTDGLQWEINDGRGPYAFQINGHNHHRIGTLLPTTDEGPRFAQFYIYDTEHEVDNRLYALNITSSFGVTDNNLRSLVQDLITMLDIHNPMVQSFRMSKDRFVQSSIQPVTLCLIGTRQHTGCQYNLPTASKVVALIPGDGNRTELRDYLLLFPYGKDGFHLHIPLNVPPTTKRKYLSLREYYCFRLQIQVNEGRTLHKIGRLFHTFCVDAYIAVLDHDLDWYKQNQHMIRSELYNGLHDRITNEEKNAKFLGRKNVLPSTFTGGPRHMIQQYQDAMAICRWTGPSDLFVTMACNPKWLKIQCEVENCIPGQSTVDRPDTIARVFKMKLDDLMDDIRKGNLFG